MAVGEVGHYEFLASAVAGRKITVRRSTGSEAHTFGDGQSITIPQSQDHWLPVAAQAALIAAGSLDAPLLRRLVGRGDAARRYVYLEVLRAAHLVQDRLPQSFTRRPDIRPPCTRSALDSLAMALGNVPLPETPDYFGIVKPLLVVRRAWGDRGFSALTGGDQQTLIAKTHFKSFDDDEETETSAILRLFQNPFSKGGPVADLLNDLLGAGVSKGNRETGAGSEGGAEMPVGRVERGLRRGISAVISKLPFGLPPLDLAADSQAQTYPEWDDRLKRYRPDWVFVETVDAWRPDGAQDKSGMLGPPPIDLRRQLSTLGLDHEPHRRQPEGAELDEAALLDCAIDLQTDQSPPALNIYRARRRTRRDLAVVVILDISGSTGDADPQGNSVFRSQIQAAYRLGHTLDSLGDTVAMIGFHSWGRKLVRVVRLKGYEERWDSRIADRLSLLEPLGYTRTGTAIRHAVRLLQTGIRLPNRLLILITDGIPYDQDYEHSYAEGDTRKSLEEARAAGTACVCLSVGAATGAAKLAEIFGAANILAVDDIGDIAGRIRLVCRQALASVASRSPRTTATDGSHHNH